MVHQYSGTMILTVGGGRINGSLDIYGGYRQVIIS